MSDVWHIRKSDVWSVSFTLMNSSLTCCIVSSIGIPIPFKKFQYCCRPWCLRWWCSLMDPYRLWVCERNYHLLQLSSISLCKWMEAVWTLESWWENKSRWRREFLKAHLHAWREGLDQTRNHDGGKVIQSSRFLIVSFTQMSFGEILRTRKFTNQLVS